VHEHDDEGDVPSWRLSGWDFAALVASLIYGISAVFTNFFSSLHIMLVGRVFFAEEQKRFREEAAHSIEKISGGE
jgi:hypothetical protein